jgi:metal transporter CNNM
MNSRLSFKGLLSLDLMEMKIKSKSGTPEEKIQAKRVLPIIERHHLLLVSLMTWNATANEALPIFLDALVPGWLAIVLSVTIVLFVGEIIPAALLTGPNQLKLASTLVPLVYVVMVIFSPIAYPISLLLDYLLGDDHGLTLYSKTELATMVKIQHEEGLTLALSVSSSPSLSAQVAIIITIWKTLALCLRSTKRR